MNNGEEPTMCHTIYKNRGSKHKSVRIWTVLDLGTVREKFLFATDDRYRKIELEATIIKTLDEQLVA